ncbi:MAG TPA: hypothetical protein VJ718_08445 [Candidatus Binataceae bacterium]|nr:hypothetical protein [Candidatus Binataceae bacterium]
MTPEQNAAPDIAAGAANAKAPEQPATSAHDELDPLRWQLPLLCKDCGKLFDVPYRHFQSGVVFHCPHCHGSFVPKAEMCRAVRDAFEDFYSRQRREREQRQPGAVGSPSSRAIDPAELREFRVYLERLAHEMRPAGKMVRRKGLRAMFT